MSSALRRNYLALLRLAALLALVFSVALYVHYIDPGNSGFCSGRSGCEAVRRGFRSYFLESRYVNIPLLGVVGYGAVFSLSLLPLPRTPRAYVLSVTSALGGLGALGFVYVQAFVVQAYCGLCLMVDAAAIACAVLGGLLVAVKDEKQRGWLQRWAWAVVGVAVAGSPPLAWALQSAPPVPEGVRAMYEPDKINVVEFADFECPFCRQLYPTLRRLNREYGERVNFQQLHVPLPGHEDALPAAAAAVCAEIEGRGDAMKHLLFTEGVDERALRGHIATLGFVKSDFENCMVSTSTAKRIERDTQLWLDAGLGGLPATFVGERLIKGGQPYPAFKEAYAAAARGEPPLSAPVWLPWALVAVVVIVAGYVGREHGKPLADG